MHRLPSSETCGEERRGTVTVAGGGDLLPMGCARRASPRRWHERDGQKGGLGPRSLRRAGTAPKGTAVACGPEAQDKPLAKGPQGGDRTPAGGDHRPGRGETFGFYSKRDGSLPRGCGGSRGRGGGIPRFGAALASEPLATGRPPSFLDPRGRGAGRARAQRVGAQSLLAAPWLLPVTRGSRAGGGVNRLLSDGRPHPDRGASLWPCSPSLRPAGWTDRQTWRRVQMPPAVPPPSLGLSFVLQNGGRGQGRRVGGGLRVPKALKPACPDR